MRNPFDNKTVLTGRAARREQARRDKRELLEVPEWRKQKMAAQSALIDRLSQNGISPQDLKKEYDHGFEDGFRMAAEPITKGCYAAVCLALRELYGFGNKRCMDVLRHIDSQLIYTMDGTELADKVLNDMKLRIVMDDPMERVQEA